MKIVEVPQDLRKIKKRVLKGLTKEQIIHFLIATPVVFISYYIANLITNSIFILSIIGFISALPIFLNLFYKKDGLKFLEFLVYKYIKEKKQKQIKFLNYKNRWIDGKKEEI